MPHFTSMSHLMLRFLRDRACYAHYTRLGVFVHETDHTRLLLTGYERTE